MRELTHLDLFSGIGGFALAAQWAGFRTVAFCEINDYCQKRLGEIWPTVPVHTDIRKLDGRPFRGTCLLTGGFPCQPVSNAGKRQGAADDRWLWPEMFRVISEARPRWIVGENVAGLDGMGLDECISELEGIGYEVAPPLEIPACAVDAVHERNRLWIIANLNGSRESQPKGNEQKQRRRADNGIEAARKVVANDAQFCGGLRGLLEAGTEWRSLLEPRGLFGDGISHRWQCAPEWFEREPRLGRLVHGIPNRTQRLEALGNAIVPQIPAIIFEGIVSIEEGCE